MMFDDADDFGEEFVPETSDPNTPFVMPSGPPQMEADRLKSIVQLMEEAPAFDAAYAPELLVLFRNHIALRSAFGLSLELAQQALNQLRVEEKNKVRSKLQGQIHGLEQFYTVVFEALKAAEAATKEPSDDPE